MPGAFDGVLTLVGLSCTGKSTVARILADRWAWSWVDLDQEIAARADLSISEIFRVHGEGMFRQLEQNALKDALQGEQVILAAGGGAPCGDGAMRRILTAGPAIWLRASEEQLADRLEVSEDRPLLQGETREQIRGLLAAQLTERASFYAQAAAQVDTDDRSPLEVALAIEASLGGTRDGPWKP